MARIPRLYRVTAALRDGRTLTHRHLTPKAAEERRERWATKHPDAIVKVDESYPIRFQRPAGDATQFDIPDTMLERSRIDGFLADLGLKPDAVRSIAIESDQLVIEYEPNPDKPNRAEPKLWRAHIIEETTP